MVDGFKYKFIDFLGLSIFIADPHELKCVCKSLYANSDGSVSEITVFGLDHWVVVAVYDLVQVLGHTASHLV